MSSNGEYTWDVFISYALADNQAPEGASHGWVSVFYKTLKQELDRTTLGKKSELRVWWDEKNLDRTGEIGPELRNQLPTVRVLVVLLSPAYVASDWCKQEREWFLAAMRDRPLAEKRVFLVDLGRVRPEDRPEPFDKQAGFKFHADDQQFGYPLPNVHWPDHSRFWRAVQSLAGEIVTRLEQITPRLKYLPPSERSVQPIATVYLAETTDDLDDRRKEMARDLKLHNFQVIPERRLPSDLEACRKQIQEMITQSGAKYFVQLLEPKLGKRFDDSDETIVTLQHQIAGARKLTILQWRGPGIDLASVTNPVLKQLLTHPDVSSDHLENFKTAILRKAAPPRALAGPEDVPTGDHDRPKIYVQSDVVDTEHARKIAMLLKNRCGVVSAYPRRSNDPNESAKLRQRTREWLYEISDGVVILYGKVGPDWVEEQLDELIKLKAKRTRPLRLGAVYIGPPKEKDEPGIFDPDVAMIDARSDDDVDVTALEPLIQKAFGPKGGVP
jgi:hypothetical protein